MSQVHDWLFMLPIITIASPRSLCGIMFPIQWDYDSNIFIVDMQNAQKASFLRNSLGTTVVVEEVMLLLYYPKAITLIPLIILFVTAHVKDRTYVFLNTL